MTLQVRWIRSQPCCLRGGAQPLRALRLQQAGPRSRACDLACGCLERRFVHGAAVQGGRGIPQLPRAPACRCLCAPCPPDAGWGLRNDATVPGTFSPISGCVASTLALDAKKNTLSDLLIGGKGELKAAPSLAVPLPHLATGSNPRWLQRPRLALQLPNLLRRHAHSSAGAPPPPPLRAAGSGTIMGIPAGSDSGGCTDPGRQCMSWCQARAVLFEMRPGCLCIEAQHAGTRPSTAPRPRSKLSWLVLARGGAGQPIEASSSCGTPAGAVLPGPWLQVCRDLCSQEHRQHCRDQHHVLLM